MRSSRIGAIRLTLLPLGADTQRRSGGRTLGKWRLYWSREAGLEGGPGALMLESLRLRPSVKWAWSFSLCLLQRDNEREKVEKEVQGGRGGQVSIQRLTQGHLVFHTGARPAPTAVPTMLLHSYFLLID